MKKKPTWQTDDHASLWERVKEAFRADWEQTKADFGVGPEAEAGERDFSELENAFRYGHSARQHYGPEHPEWNDDLAAKLQDEYPHDWRRDEPLISYAYLYNYSRTI